MSDSTLEPSSVSAAAASPASAPESRPKRFLNLFTVHSAVSVLNFLTYLVASILSIALFVFLNSSQGFVLGQIINLPTSQLGSATGSLTFYDELLTIPMVWVWGVASDRVGRAWVYGLGFLFMGLALVLYTYAQNVFPALLLFRLIFSLGAAAASSMLTAVLADYADDQDRGKIAGLVGAMSGVGALVALFGFLRIPTLFPDPLQGLRITHFIVGGFSIVFGLFAMYALRIKRRDTKPLVSVGTLDQALPADHPPVHDPSASCPVVPHDSTPSRAKTAADLMRTSLAGFRAAADGKVLLGYIGGFLARGDTIIITIFLPLWIYKYYIKTGLCPGESDYNDPNIDVNCRQAYLTASVLGGVAQTLALIGAPIFGWLSDRLYRPIVTMIASVIGFAGYFAMFLTTNPTSSAMYGVVCLVGLGEIGMIVSSLSLVTSKAVPHSVRGSVAGMYSLFGAVGILINSKLGGYLFDAWTEGSPFFVMSIGHAISFVVAIVVIFSDIRQLRKQNSLQSADSESALINAESPSRKEGLLSRLKRRQNEQAELSIYS
ncbi:major facilitator superfamily domain-containing protein [Polychytrium aggregatum]|uniref:major facilitator superfamily domain-containing protein n=1 Tax=Polychytrium aggregatum TaxID=110093 RepID=UPI0022FEAD29|nr:major facilitator superfamily domain-containing protein [Polychytrium aggregatum]KAI9203643.1 major facilitator superfamily domain-containing protein [Polychytrium aggregatum]